DITDRSASESNTSILGTTPAALLSTSPNPLERSTNFSFSIPETETAKLEVINLNGESSVLFSGKVQGGVDNNIAFDASNLASGIYFVQLSTPTQNVKNKIIIIK
ncbi:MAG: T9SS type A sorting domain-containing protein, partial [Flavobacteriales bacterium]|nr:T9SS type A sorting domain-containing protein [Flavobacteriales bacterium]